MEMELQDGLLRYLGELMAVSEQTFDWIEKDALIEQINAVNLLLGFDTRHETWFEKVSKAIKQL